PGRQLPDRNGRAGGCASTDADAATHEGSGLVVADALAPQSEDAERSGAGLWRHNCRLIRGRAAAAVEDGGALPLHNDAGGDATSLLRPDDAGGLDALGLPACKSSPAPVQCMTSHYRGRLAPSPTGLL